MTLVQSVLQRIKMLRNTRLYRRLAASDVEVKITPQGDSTPITRKVGNWSPGGIFVLTSVVLPLETKVRLELPIDAPDGPVIQLDGQVVRHQQNKTTGDYEGMGIMFTDFTQKGLRILQELLLSASKQSGSS